MEFEYDSPMSHSVMLSIILPTHWNNSYEKWKKIKVFHVNSRLSFICSSDKIPKVPSSSHRPIFLIVFSRYWPFPLDPHQSLLWKAIYYYINHVSLRNTTLGNNVLCLILHSTRKSSVWYWLEVYKSFQLFNFSAL